MYFSMITKLWFLLILVCQRVSSWRNSFSQNETFPYTDNEIGDVLEKFFIDFNMAYLKIHEPRFITVIGASANELQQIKTLFESYPYIICKETEVCAYSKEFSEGTFIIVFLKDLGGETFGKNINIPSRWTKSKVLFVSNEIIQTNDIWLTVTSAMQDNVRYSRFARFHKNTIELYSNFVTKNCSKQFRLITVWKPGASFDRITEWAVQRNGMNGCPVFVSSLTFTPKILLKENENGSLTIVAGREGRLLMALASKLNFTIKLRYPSVEDRMKYSRKIAIYNDVISGISEIGIGRLRPTILPNNRIEMSFPYDDECITWGVPRVMKWSNNIVWVEFSWQVWVLVGVVFTLGCILRYTVVRNTVTSNDERKSLGFATIIVDAVALHVGNPIMSASSSMGGRFMLITYLYYAMVVTTAYKTSLASILASEDGIPTIVDTQGMINANLNLSGSFYDYTILENQVNDTEHTSKLLERFVINNDDTTIWNQLFLGKGWAILGRRSYINYQRQLFLKSHESLTFNILNGCVLAYPTVMFFRIRSFHHKSVDQIIRRLIESGITKHWDIDELDADFLLKRKSVEKYFDKRATYKFRSIFIYYSFCLLISIFTFLIELLTLRFD